MQNIGVLTFVNFGEAFVYGNPSNYSLQDVQDSELLDRGPEMEHYHPSWQFTKPPFPRSLLGEIFNLDVAIYVQGGGILETFAYDVQSA